MRLIKLRCPELRIVEFSNAVHCYLVKLMYTEKLDNSILRVYRFVPPTSLKQTYMKTELLVNIQSNSNRYNNVYREHMISVVS